MEIAHRKLVRLIQGLPKQTANTAVNIFVKNLFTLHLEKKNRSFKTPADSFKFKVILNLYTST